MSEKDIELLLTGEEDRLQLVMQLNDPEFRKRIQNNTTGPRGRSRRV